MFKMMGKEIFTILLNWWTYDIAIFLVIAPLSFKHTLYTALLYTVELKCLEYILLRLGSLSIFGHLISILLKRGIHGLVFLIIIVNIPMSAENLISSRIKKYFRFKKHGCVCVVYKSLKITRRPINK